MDELVRLPGAWWAQFDGTALDAKAGTSAVLATVDEEGWPHLSYLSAGEILSQPDERISLALWPNSRTAANVARTGRAVLHALADREVWEARLTLRRRAAGAEGGLAVFDGGVQGVRRHAAPYAEVLGLVAFRLLAPEETLHRWRRQIELMRRPGGG